MVYLPDSNILVRLADSLDRDHALADGAVQRLLGRGDIPAVTPQGMIEFRGVATRPKPMTGLGLTPAEAEQQAADFERLFPLVPDTADIYPRWKALVSAYGVKGKQVHDARMATVCFAHHVGRLLTFNVADFTRYAAHPPGLTAVHPARV